MIERAILAAATMAFVAAPAAAQFSFGVEVGPPGYPRYYPGPPGYTVAPPRGYDAPPIYVPIEPVPRRVSPDAVFDALEDAGYRDFGIMVPRGDRFELSAVNRRGDLVSLEVSVFTGEIVSERVLKRHRRARQRASAPEPALKPVPPVEPFPETAEEPSGAADDEGRDPLVVY